MNNSKLKSKKAGAERRTMLGLAFLLNFAFCIFNCWAAPLTNSINGHVRLAWGYDTNELSTNLNFNIYATTNLAVPFSQWPLLTNVTGTNLSVDCVIQPGAWYFVGTASNFWGETSITSNLVSTPPAPQPINDTLKISKQ